jgi:CheY-like chemotaxis protein
MMATKLIVLVEDNPDDEALTLMALEKQNLAKDVVVLHDGVEALEFLLSPDNPLPDLVLLDINMPKVDGLEVLRRLRSEPRTAFLPIVLLTASDEERDVRDGYRFGANSYMRKPVSFDQLSDAVRHLGLYWLVLNQRPGSH